jgi:hypothetical protein
MTSILVAVIGSSASGTRRKWRLHGADRPPNPLAVPGDALRATDKDTIT